MTRAAGYSAERFAVGRGDAASGEGRWKPIDRGPSCEAVPAGTHPPRRRSTTVRDSLPGVSTSLRPSPMDRSRTVADSRRTGSLASEVGPGSRATWARLLATQLGPEPHPSLNYKAILKNVPGTSSAIAHSLEGDVSPVPPLLDSYNQVEVVGVRGRGSQVGRHVPVSSTSPGGSMLGKERQLDVFGESFEITNIGRSESQSDMVHSTASSNRKSETSWSASPTNRGRPSSSTHGCGA